MDKTFKEAIAGIRTAERGVDVREDIAQGMEYVEQYASEVVSRQDEAVKSAQTAASAASVATEKASTATEKAEAAASSATAAASSQTAAGLSEAEAKSSAEAAAKSAKEAAASASTDPTLSIAGAPADAKAVGDALKKPATSTTLGGVKVGSGLTVAEDGTLSADSALSAYPVGSLYLTTSSASPAALFGGEWEEIASERVLMGASSAHKAGTTVDAGLPNITGRTIAIPMLANSQGGVAATKPWFQGAFEPLSTIVSDPQQPFHVGYSSDGFDTYYSYFDASRLSAVYGASDTVQPAAYYVHIWHRVA